MPASLFPIETNISSSEADTRIRLLDDGSTVIEYITGAAPTNQLVITFSHYGSNDLNALGYAEQMWRARGFDVLAVKTAQNDWFQTLSLDQMSNVRVNIPEYQKVVTFGSDMGGYAALYFAESLDAEIAITLSPQYSVDPAIMPSETRWASDSGKITFSHKPLSEVLKNGKARLAILYDPHNFDRIHVENMNEVRQRLVPLAIRYGGHPVGITLEEVGEAESIITDLLEGKTPDVRAIMRKKRKQSAQYLFFLALASVAKGHVSWAHNLFTEATKRDSRPEILLEHSRFLAGQHNPKGALTLLELALERVAPDAHLLAYHAHLKDLCGDQKTALALFNRTIQLEPGFAGFYVAERALLHRILEEQSRQLDMRERITTKLLAERNLKRGPVPGRYGIQGILGFTVIPIIIAGAVWAVAWSFNIV